MTTWTPAMPTSGDGVLPEHWHRGDFGTWQYDGTIPAYLSGHAIGRWDDIAYNADHIRQAVIADKPQLMLNAVNGQPAILFGGGYAHGDHLQGHFTSGGDISTPYTIFIVAQLDASVVNDNNSEYLMYSDSASAYAYCVGYGADNPDSWGIGDTGGFLHDGTEDSAWNIWAALFGHPNSILRHNGVSVVSGSGAGVTALEGLTIGARYDGSISWKGYVAEILIYSGALSVVDQDQIGCYLRDRYGISYTRVGGATLTTGAPVLGTPTLYSIGTESLTTDDLITGAPVLGTPRIGDWTPAQPTDDGGVSPRQWLRSDLGLYTLPLGTPAVNDGDVISRWLDQSGNGYYMMGNTGSPTTLPTLQNDSADLINGHPVVRADGVNDYLYRSGTSLGLTGDVALTAFFVVNNIVSSDGRALYQLGYYLAGSNISYEWGPSDGGPCVRFGSGGNEFYVGAAAWTSPRIVMWQRQVGDLYGDGEYFQDGVEIPASGSLNPTGGPMNLSATYPYTRLFWATTAGTTQYAAIDIAEVIIYNAFLSESDRQQVEEYLFNRYLGVYDLEADDITTGAPVLGTPSLYLNDLETDGILTGAPDLGHPTLTTPTVWIDDVDKSDIFISSERIDEYCNPGVRVTLTFTEKFDADTWGPVVLYEDGVKVFTGTIVRTESNRSEYKSYVIHAKDDIRRLREYFVVEEYASMGESVQYWISFFAALAGCSTITYTDYGNNPNTLDGMTMGRMFAFDIIDELLLYAGMDIWCDENNDMFVGTRMDSDITQSPVEAGDNLSSFARSRDSEPCRNAAKVYTVIGTAAAQSTESWQIDSGDVRTMVVSSIYVNTIEAGENLARRMVEAAGPEYDIKRMILDDVETDREIGDLIPFDDGVDNAGTGRITSITSRVTGDAPVKEMHLTLDERCPKIGAGGLSEPDGRDVTVATYDFGVWRCKDIWASYPHWEPMNNGLTASLYFEGVDMGGTFNTDWFIRDPYLPSSMAFLLTKSGLLQTTSLEPGYEQWTPTLMNSHIGVMLGDTWSNWQDWHIVKIRSTVASEGKYFIAVTRKTDFFENLKSYVGMTTQRFVNFSSCDGVWGPGAYAYSPGVDQCGVSDPYRTCALWGNNANAFGYEEYVSLGSWHRGAGGNQGGFAAWHRKGNGCSITGKVATFASNGGPEWWNCYERIDPDTGEIELNTPLGLKYKGYSPPDSCECVKRGPTSNGKFQTFVVNTGCFQYYDAPALVLYGRDVGIHIPYDQQHNDDGSPSKIFYMPGWFTNPSGYTVNGYPSLNQIGPIVLPWDYCNTLQGSFATHGSDINKQYAFSPEATTRFAISDDGGATWIEKASIPIKTSCYSGFPTSSSKVYAGMHPDLGFYSTKTLLYVSWDRGDTWTDVTGDLWDEAARLYPTLRGGKGPSGIVTIAPRYSK